MSIMRLWCILCWSGHHLLLSYNWGWWVKVKSKGEDQHFLLGICVFRSIPSASIHKNDMVFTNMHFGNFFHCGLNGVAVCFFPKEFHCCIFLLI